MSSSDHVLFKYLLFKCDSDSLSYVLSYILYLIVLLPFTVRKNVVKGKGHLISLLYHALLHPLILLVMIH